MTSSIAKKIQRIIAKADSTTSEAEAEAFMAKAHALMEEHGVSLLQLGKLDEEDPLGHDREVYRSSDRWKDKVAWQLARYYGCEMVTDYITNSTSTYTVIGRESARVTFTLMMPYIAKQVMAIALKEWRAGNYNTRTQAQSQIAAALAVRLYHLREEARAKTEEKQGASGLNALVPVDLIQQEMETLYPNIRMVKVKHSYDANAEKKASGISLNRQTSAAAGTKRLGAN